MKAEGGVEARAEDESRGVRTGYSKEGGRRDELGEVSGLDPEALIGFWGALLCSAKRLRGGGPCSVCQGSLEEVVLEGKSLFCFPSRDWSVMFRFLL